MDRHSLCCGSSSVLIRSSKVLVVRCPVLANFSRSNVLFRCHLTGDVTPLGRDWKHRSFDCRPLLRHVRFITDWFFTSIFFDVAVLSLARPGRHHPVLTQRSTVLSGEKELKWKLYDHGPKQVRPLHGGGGKVYFPTLLVFTCPLCCPLIPE